MISASNNSRTKRASVSPVRSIREAGAPAQRTVSILIHLEGTRIVTMSGNVAAAGSVDASRRTKSSGLPRISEPPIRVLAAELVEDFGNDQPGTAMSMATSPHSLCLEADAPRSAQRRVVGTRPFHPLPGHSSITLYTPLYLTGNGLDEGHRRASCVGIAYSWALVIRALPGSRDHHEGPPVRFRILRGLRMLSRRTYSRATMPTAGTPSACIERRQTNKSKTSEPVRRISRREGGGRPAVERLAAWHHRLLSAQEAELRQDPWIRAGCRRSRLPEQHPRIRPGIQVPHRSGRAGARSRSRPPWGRVSYDLGGMAG